MNTSAAGMIRTASISTKLVNAVGFSNGCAELTLKNPPPLVPSSLIASWEATGPMPIDWVRPVTPCTVRYVVKFWIEPWQTRTSAITIDSGSRT